MDIKDIIFITLTIIGVLLTAVGLIFAFWRLRLLNKQINRIEKSSNENRQKSIEALNLVKIQIRDNRKQAEDQHDWYRREKSIQYSGLYHPNIKKVKSKLEVAFRLMSRIDPIPLEDLHKGFSNDSKLQSELNYLLTYYENIAIAIKMKVANEDIIKLMLRGSFIRTRKKLLNYIDKQREDAKHIELWENFVKLSDSWNNENIVPIEELNQTGKI